MLCIIFLYIPKILFLLPFLISHFSLILSKIDHVMTYNSPFFLLKSVFLLNKSYLLFDNILLTLILILNKKQIFENYVRAQWLELPPPNLLVNFILWKFSYELESPFLPPTHEDWPCLSQFITELKKEKETNTISCNDDQE